MKSFEEHIRNLSQQMPDSWWNPEAEIARFTKESGNWMVAEIIYHMLKFELDKKKK